MENDIVVYTYGKINLLSKAEACIYSLQSPLVEQRHLDRTSLRPLVSCRKQESA